ncbi:MAG: alpha/beta hydrolase [Lachnospiraceae bacterium]|nr:alpha/beta hydrolase [Lachnospiraceae bacterium]
MDKVTKIKINDHMMKIHIITENEENPVILFIHGGPGGINRHDVMHNHLDLLDRFTLVGWDQRGTGGSYTGTDFSTMTAQQIVDDAEALIEWLCKRFHKDKIFILCLSWGSYVGTVLAAQHPEHVAAYIGYGQLVHGHRNEVESYRWVLEQAKKAGNEEDVKTLEALGEPVNGMYLGGPDALHTQRGLLNKYGGVSPRLHGDKYMDGRIGPMKASGEYTRLDWKGYRQGAEQCLIALWPTVGMLDFITDHTKFEVPFYIFQGHQDWNTPWTLLSDWFGKIEAPDKDLIFFENSGHNPMSDEPEAFKKAMREKFEAVMKKDKSRI